MKKYAHLVCIFLVSFLTPLLAAAQLTGYRADILYFTGNPAKESNAYRYYPDGVLFVKDGIVVESGLFSQLSARYPHARIVDYRGKLIIPGFIDTHIHYPQAEMVGAYGSQLLEWLDKDVFPVETKFSDSTHAAAISRFFLDELIRQGTTTALVFTTTYPLSVDAFFSAALDKNMRMIAGKVLMDRNAPGALLDTPEQGYQDSQQLIKKWHNKGRLSYAVTPRFAPTSSPEQLQVAGRLLREYPDIYLHTHLAENLQEVAWVKALFPDSRSYLDVYASHGLVTPRSVFAHGIHLDDADYRTLQSNNSALAFCSVSNAFLGSGLFNLDKAAQHQIRVGLGTDVGGGNSFSVLQAMNEAYKITQLRKAFTPDPDEVTPLSPMENLYLATLGGARALSLDSVIGNFAPGKEADFIVLTPDSSPVLALRAANSRSLEDKIFAYEMLGDDRTVLHTYIMGKQEK